MIVPNLMVSDMQASIAFYRDLLGFTLAFALDSERGMHDDPVGKPIVFASLKWGEAELMLQTVESLAEDLPVFQHLKAHGQRDDHACAATIPMRSPTKT
jgi:catechol 2,3-dioxygenase-like lactoylglutathione lyase family enzyme